MSELNLKSDGLSEFKTGMNSLIRGLRDFCESHPEAEKAKALYERMDGGRKSVTIDETEYEF